MSPLVDILLYQTHWGPCGRQIILAGLLGDIAFSIEGESAHFWKHRWLRPVRVPALEQLLLGGKLLVWLLELLLIFGLLVGRWQG